LADVEVRVSGDEGPLKRVEAAFRSSDQALQAFTANLGKLKAEGAGVVSTSKGIAEGIAQVNGNVDRFLRTSLSRNLRQDLRATGQQDTPWQQWDWGKMYGPRAASHRASFLSQAFYQTPYQFAEDHNVPGGGSGFPPIIGGAGRSLMRWGGLALGLAGIGGLASTVSASVDRNQNEGIQLDFFRNQIGDTSKSFEEFRTVIRDSVRSMGIANIEAVQLARSFARAAASTDLRETAAGVRDSSAFARSFGMEPGTATSVFGRMRLAGVTGAETGQGMMTQREFAMMLGDSIARGGMFSRADEVMGAIARWVESSERTLVRTPNVRAYADMLGGMNAQTDMPGLRGAAGEALLGQLDAGIRSPGSGEAGVFAMYRAIGRGMDPWRFQYLQSEGIFGSPMSAFGARGAGGQVDPNDPRNKGLDATTNLERVLNYAAGISGDPYKRAIATSSWLNLSPQQAMALFELRQRNGGGVSGWGNQLQGLLDSSGVKLEDVNQTGIRELGRVAYAKPDELGKIRDDFIRNNPSLTDQQKSGLAGKEGEDLRKELARVIAATGKEVTEGSRMLTSMTDIKNEITAMSDKLVPLVSDIREAVTGFGASAYEKGLDAAMAGAKTPEERRAIADRAREDFKRIHGVDPKAEFSWSGVLGRAALNLGSGKQRADLEAYDRAEKAAGTPLPRMSDPPGGQTAPQSAAPRTQEIKLSGTLKTDKPGVEVELDEQTVTVPMASGMYAP